VAGSFPQARKNPGETYTATLRGLRDLGCRDSNPEPSDPESDVLPVELQPIAKNHFNPFPPVCQGSRKPRRGTDSADWHRFTPQRQVPRSHRHPAGPKRSRGARVAGLPPLQLFGGCGTLRGECWWGRFSGVARTPAADGAPPYGGVRQRSSRHDGERREVGSEFHSGNH
jgi:hypothetical protein